MTGRPLLDLVACVALVSAVGGATCERVEQWHGLEWALGTYVAFSFLVGLTVWQLLPAAIGLE